MATKTSTGWMEATETFVFVLGARQPTYRVVVVRDRHTGQLAEVPLTEEPPIDPGDESRTFVVKKGDLYLPDDEVVQHKPQHFRPAAARALWRPAATGPRRAGVPPGDGITVYVFAKGELVPEDHPAVLAAPDAFIPAPPGD